MGTFCSKKNSEYLGRDDVAGQRRLSAYVLGPGGGDIPEHRPPTVEYSTSSIDPSCRISLSVHAKSLAGTYAPQSFKDNQDDFFSETPFVSDDSLSLFAVFDGHGAYGGQSSKFVKKTFCHYLSKDTQLKIDHKASLKSAFLNTHRDTLKCAIDTSCSGTTAVLCLRHNNQLYVSNAGDSRCVLGSINSTGSIVSKQLSYDHKPDHPEERKRIELSGGRVDTIRGPRNEPLGPARVWLGQELYPGLAMSRSIGDSIAHQAGCTAEPDIIEHTINIDSDKFIILASDGVWEFISSQEAVEIVSKCETPQIAADLLTSCALSKWRQEEEICDDITAVIVFFSKMEL
eukprot:c19191_g1_i1.p1 GENE.c19191_g1_i1~~c19191_g1_i1.p1  ORF type:complete len:359 (+),score=142.78 c19191_g1_i1:47-1078(+)